MTIKELFAYIDEVKPNAYSPATKTRWLNELEGKIQNEIMLIAQPECVSYVFDSTTELEVSFPDDHSMALARRIPAHVGGYLTVSQLTEYSGNNKAGLEILNISADGKRLSFAAGSFLDTGDEPEEGKLVFKGEDTEPLVKYPFDRIYASWMLMKISEHLEESAQDVNATARFKDDWEIFAAWFADTYRPADGVPAFKGYYLQGKQGEQGRKGDTGEDGRGIESAEIVNGHLIITYTDGETEDAGEVNPTEIDDTLSAEGAAADAKATGDAIAAVDKTYTVTGGYDGAQFGTMSATHAQILAAYNAGKTVELRMVTDAAPSLYVLPMAGRDESGNIIFGGVDGAEYEDGHLAVKVKVTSANVWSFEYLDGSSGGGIPDAPSDGKQYARKDGAWVVVEGDTPPEVTNAIATGGIGWTSEAMIIEWNGDTTGLDEFSDPELPYKLYKVTDRTIPKDNIIGGVITANVPAPTTFTIQHVFESEEDVGFAFVGYAVIIQEDLLALVITESGEYSAGTYLAHTDSGVFTSKLQSAGEEIIHKIDGKYLPAIPTRLADLTGDTTHRTVTDTEKAAWDGKQDAISDLATIRSGAALGATALQTAPVSSVNGKTGAVNLVPADLGIGSVFALKGSKPTYADLPATGNTIGDVWYVIADSVGYIWLNDGTIDRWEQLGMEIDLSAYRTAAAQDIIDNGKVAISQGVAQAGKFLVVGDDGNVTTQSIEFLEGGDY